jgi:hypothetical protein
MVDGLVAGGPVDGGSLHEAEAQALVGDDGGRARGLAIHSRSGVLNAEAVEPPERRPDRFRAVVDVVGGADRVIPADDEGLGGGERRVEAFVFQRVLGGRFVEAALQISEQDVGVPQRLLDPRERHLRIDDVHEVDVAGQHERSSHGSPLSFTPGPLPDSCVKDEIHAMPHSTARRDRCR